MRQIRSTQTDVIRPKCCQEDRDLSGVYGPRLAERHQEQDEFTCLNLNVTRPLTGHGLPVLVWIHGSVKPIAIDNLLTVTSGAFLMGSAAEPSFDPAKLVAWSVRRGKPLLVVAVKYVLARKRLAPLADTRCLPTVIVWVHSAFSTLRYAISISVPSRLTLDQDLDEQAREIPWRGNFGLHDQRVALDWIQRHIRGFGGDVSRRTGLG